VRDLNRERRPVVSLSDDPDATDATAELPEPRVARAAYEEARADRSVAAMAGLVLRVTERMEPVVAALTAKALAIVMAAAAVALTAYTLRVTEDGWQRASVLGGFLVLAAWAIRGLMRR